MICTTIRKDENCVFMTAKGCSFTGGSCQQILESCQGCKRTVEYDGNTYCSASPDPAAKWKNGNCNLATHVVTVPKTKTQKINPIKASKRGH